MVEFYKSDFYYDLPPELIAQHPASPRDSSRLLCYSCATDKVEHRIFRELPKLLKKGDVLVVNHTRVIPARLFAYDEKGREYETLLLKRLDATRWECLLKPAKKAKIGAILTVNSELSFTVEEIGAEGVRIIDFHFDGVFEEVLDKVGQVPLPPYITEKLEEKERYQTVYAKVEGSAATPTAGLHFTPELLDELRAMGVEVVEVLLHVGLGTFRPVKEDKITDHKMHSEYFCISSESAERINLAKREGRRVIAVGTTSVRALESATDENGVLQAGSGNTEIFIYPSYRFRIADALITNFHLPESTLIMLVSALIGREKTLELYRLAVEEKYRFFSFGDAMFLS